MAGAVNLDDLIGSVVGTTDTTTAVKVASGTAATAKAGSGIAC